MKRGKKKRLIVATWFPKMLCCLLLQLRANLVASFDRVQLDDLHAYLESALLVFSVRLGGSRREVGKVFENAGKSIAKKGGSDRTFPICEKSEVESRGWYLIRVDSVENEKEEEEVEGGGVCVGRVRAEEAFLLGGLDEGALRKTLRVGESGECRSAAGDVENGGRARVWGRIGLIGRAKEERERSANGGCGEICLGRLERTCRFIVVVCRWKSIERVGSVIRSQEQQEAKKRNGVTKRKRQAMHKSTRGGRAKGEETFQSWLSGAKPGEREYAGRREPKRDKRFVARGSCPPRLSPLSSQHRQTNTRSIRLR